MTPEQRHLLMDSLIDGTITEAEMLKIEAELTVSHAVRQEYYQRIQLNLLLEREIPCQPRSTDQPVPHSIQQRRVTDRVAAVTGVALAVIAVVAIAVTLTAYRSNNDAERNNPSLATDTEPSASGFAVLIGQVSAVWNGNATGEGDLLPVGELHLKSGTIHVELFSGVQMVIEGEARFRIESPMEVKLHTGRARAMVPEPAHGFTIRTSSGDIVDLGTEFSVDVNDDHADLHVVEGEVQIRNSQASAATIPAGSRLRMNHRDGVIEPLNSTVDIIAPQEFRTVLDARLQQRRARWLAASEQSHADPRMTGHWHFYLTSPLSRTLKNLATGSGQMASDGTVIGAMKSADRWGNNDAALDFGRVGSRVRVSVPGEHRGLSLICWVRINSLDRWYNSLFLTDGHEEGEPHWQIMNDGRIFFSVKHPIDQTGQSDRLKQHVYYSPPVWETTLNGRWIMLGVTYDVDNRQVTHYVNGHVASAEDIPEHALVEFIQIGDASICNWSEPMYRTDPEFVLRNLNGSMDEFAIYSGALSPAEILTLYEAGDPNE